MYIALIVIAIAASAFAIVRGVRFGRRALVWTGAFGIAATVLFFGLLSFWGELLWFRELGFEDRLWKEVLVRALSAAAGAGIGGVFVFALTRANDDAFAARHVPILVGIAVGALWGLASWDVVIRFLYRADSGTRDPVFSLDAGFYLFSLPLLDNVFWFLVVLVLISLFPALATSVGRLRWASKVRQAVREDELGFAEIARWPSDESAEVSLSHVHVRRRAFAPIYSTLGAGAAVMAAGAVLGALHLMYSRAGAVHGPGYTDVHIRLPAYGVLASVLALTSVVFLVPPLWRGLDGRASRTVLGIPPGWPRTATLGLGVVFGTWLFGLGLLPPLFQWLRVVPNEISLERPYLAANIALTREAFRLHEVEDAAFPVSAEFTEQTVANNPNVLSEVRLWDPRALQAVFEQFQELRLYYDFTSLDVDRYTLGSDYRQVMVAPREIAPGQLPRANQTFVNRHFKYTHGFGLAMAPVSEFTSDGLPVFVLRDLPPVASFPELEIEYPEVYYGERTTDFVIANSKEPEFHYPSGDKNVYTHYQGTGGVPLQNFWRKLVYGWKLGGTKLLLSGYPTEESRVMFHREIHDRVRTLAPFLELDVDPYVAVVDGKQYWIVDAYTTSRHYPYSTPFSAEELTEREFAENRRVAPERTISPAVGYLEGANYVRNAVKAVIDAYDGSVTLYVFDSDDPIIRVWDKAFPGLFKPRSEMPAGLVAHVRYPEGFLLAQGLVYRRYHMTEPDVFYNQEDLWVRATELYYDNVQPVDPYYVMWRPSGVEKAQFTLIQPFTPKNRQVLIGWIAGMSDDENYGRLIAFRFPKDKWVLGTQQLDTKVDQDPVLSAQLTLWNQEGKRVIRGNVLVIPIDDTLLYVEPIYIQADAAAYPELRVVVAMHQENMSYGPRFDDALRGLLAGPGRPVLGIGGGPPEASLVQLSAEANRAFDSYIQLLGRREYEQAAKELETLENTLRKMTSPRPPSP